jgi:S-adenosylmethionine-diacylgycerolhomoserine-N-methlytransferase
MNATHTPGAVPALIEIAAQADRMDRMYRWQRHIYDLTRKYYLLGRDTLLTGVVPMRDEVVIEIGCGTGRNLIWLASRHPHAQFRGVDASAEMLTSAQAAIARRGVGDRVRVAQGLAEQIDMRRLFGAGDGDRFDGSSDFSGFSGIDSSDRGGRIASRDRLAPAGTFDAADHVIISYALSMMTDPIAAIARAAALLRPGGTLHIVDFWDLAGYPAIFRRSLIHWLDAFGVHHRPEVIDGLRAWAAVSEAELDVRPLYGRYAWLARARTTR